MTARDVMSRPVPAGLASAFEGRDRLTACLVALRNVQVQLDGLLQEKFAGQIDKAVVRRAFEVLHQEVLHNAPAYRCRCPASVLECPRCGGKRWLSQNQVEMTSNRDPVPISKARLRHAPNSLTCR